MHKLSAPFLATRARVDIRRTLSLWTCRVLRNMQPGSKKRAGAENGSLSPPPVRRKIAATTTSKAVANFFKPAAEREPEKIAFHTAHETLLVARHESAHTISRTRPVKIAVFDLDDTLIATKSGLKFARGEDDWRWWHPAVPSRLKALHAGGYAIVIMSNQGSVSLRADVKPSAGGTRSLNNIKGKISAIFKSLEMPMSVYAATGPDTFRKPRTGMWEQLLRDYSLTKSGDVDLANSFFVGDAGGRADDKVSGTKKDHSCCDRDLAANIGIAFHTPEEFFLEQDVRPFTRSFDPAAYLESVMTSDTDATPILFGKKNELDLVLFCGSPGAGKSTFFWQHMQPLGYERVNQDLLKTRPKCMKVASDLLEDKRSVVVDNTNADLETRAAWLGLAKKLGVPVRLVHFTADARLCEHNDTVRALGGDSMNPEKRQLLPKMAFVGFTGRYREPRLEEGFQDITKVDFRFEGSEEQKAIWKKFWLS